MALTFGRNAPPLPGWTLAALLLAGAAGAAEGAEAVPPSGELRVLWADRSDNRLGPLAEARRLQPGIVPPGASSAVGEAELRWSGQGLGMNLLLSHEQPDGGPASSSARFNELQWSGKLDASGAWQASLGKKIIAWDVGYGFRPNDVVEQQARRTLLDTTPEGRPLLALEYFGADDAASVVWVNPQRIGDADDEQRGAGESALAARWYHRAGGLDAYAFARLGQHTAASLGIAGAWVATESLELHASGRWLQRHDAWLSGAPEAGAVRPANPWRPGTLGRASQWLLGGQWTGDAQQSLLVEAWHDGTAPSNAMWRDWALRNATLAVLASQPALPPPVRNGVAANLAWQASPFDTPTLRRDNLFVRLAWQPGAWLCTLDALVTPADGARIVTAGLQWQGDRWRLNAAWRRFGGPRGAVSNQLPLHATGLLAATLAF